jgi:purine nucleoside phosphorylase
MAPAPENPPGAATRGMKSTLAGRFGSTRVYTPHPPPAMAKTMAAAAAVRIQLLCGLSAEGQGRTRAKRGVLRKTS